MRQIMNYSQGWSSFQIRDCCETAMYRKSIALSIGCLHVIAYVVCQMSSQPSSSISLTHLTLQTPKAIILSNAIPQMYVTCFSALLPPLLVHFCWSREQLVHSQQHKLGLCTLCISAARAHLHAGTDCSSPGTLPMLSRRHHLHASV